MNEDEIFGSSKFLEITRQHMYLYFLLKEMGIDML